MAKNPLLSRCPHLRGLAKLSLAIPPVPTPPGNTCCLKQQNHQSDQSVSEHLELTNPLDEDLCQANGLMNMLSQESTGTSGPCLLKRLEFFDQSSSFALSGKGFHTYFGSGWIMLDLAGGGFGSWMILDFFKVAHFRPKFGHPQVITPPMSSPRSPALPRSVPSVVPGC